MIIHIPAVVVEVIVTRNLPRPGLPRLMYCSSRITPISDSKRASSHGETQEENPERAETRPRIRSGRGPEGECTFGAVRAGTSTRT